MVKTKGIERTLANWKAGQGKAPENYKAGVQATTDQNERAIAAEDLYAAKTQEAIANKSRVKGLQKSSTEAWKKAAIDKGAARIGPGMAAAEDEYRTGMSEVLSVIEATTIAERSADPMANIDNRLKPIAQNLWNMKRR